jgi:hypothetical protein
LVDGYEFAYAFKERGQFLEGRRRIHEEALTLSAMSVATGQRCRLASVCGSITTASRATSQRKSGNGL